MHATAKIATLTTTLKTIGAADPRVPCNSTTATRAAIHTVCHQHRACCCLISYCHRAKLLTHMGPGGRSSMTPRLIFLHWSSPKSTLVVSTLHSSYLPLDTGTCCYFVRVPLSLPPSTAAAVAAGPQAVTVANVGCRLGTSADSATFDTLLSFLGLAWPNATSKTSSTLPTNDGRS